MLGQDVARRARQPPVVALSQNHHNIGLRRNVQMVGGLTRIGRASICHGVLALHPQGRE